MVQGTGSGDASDASPPATIAPMIAVASELPADESAWAFEVKWDGVRAIASVAPESLRLSSRSGRDITANYPELGGLPAALRGHRAVLDGELIAFDEHGRQQFQAVQQRIHVTGAAAIAQLSREVPATFMVFDLLWLDGHALDDVPYEERRALLDGLELDDDRWHVPDFHVGAGTALMAATREQGLEGVIAKQLGSGYEPGGRSRAWRKIKHARRQEVVIGGFTPGRGNRVGEFGALQLGVWNDDGTLTFAGGVGSGFSAATLRDVRARLEPLVREASPFTDRQPPRETVFVEPELVCEVTFAEWSRDGSLRHAVFRGLREDLDPRAVRREDAPAGTGSARSASTAPGTLAIEEPAVACQGREVKVTNLDKILYPDTGTTKRDVIAYYSAIAPVLVPHLAGRPTTLKRYPDGVEADSFFEKNANRHRPDWVSTVAMETSDGKSIDFVDVDAAPTLLWTANLAAIELHPSLARVPDTGRPTMLVFDLDPGPGTSIVECCRVGLEIESLLTRLDLRSWAKTSGSKGLQLYAPINVDVTYDDTKAFAHAVASLLEDRHPELVVSRMKKSLRGGKVLVDWSQNDRNKTTVAVYSMRARPRPTVSTPVTWDEVEACAADGDPEALVFTTGDVLARVEADGDLFAPLLTVEQDLPALGR